MGCIGSKKKGITTTKSLEKVDDLKVQSANFVFRKKGDIKDFYHVGQKLGSGAFGSVLKARQKSTGQVRAIKSVRKAHLTQDMTDTSRFFNEIDILRQTDHPNIVKLYEFFEDDKFFHMITELLSGGELFDYIITSKTLSESVAAHFLKQIVSAVAYCHSNGIVHRDIKPENLLLDANSSTATVKVIDFGTSTLFEPDEKLKQRYGTSYYIAPEVLNRKYDSKCDIWSCGVILYILLSGTPPFPGRDDEEILSKVKKGSFSMSASVWNTVSDEGKELIRKMLTMNPEMRPSAIEVLKDPWFKVAETREEATNLGDSLNSLKKFRADLKLQQAVMTFISSQLLTKEDTKELTAIFKSLDKNGDGKLSKEELLDGYLSTMNAAEAEEEVNRIMNEVDVDANGFIEYTEFVTATMNREKMLSKHNLEAAFSIFDIDGSGSITVQELKEVLGSELQSTDNVWEDLIRQADVNGDGEIDIKEFKDMMLKLV